MNGGTGTKLVCPYVYINSYIAHRFPSGCGGFEVTYHFLYNRDFTYVTSAHPACPHTQGRRQQWTKCGGQQSLPTHYLHPHTRTAGTGTAHINCALPSRV